MPAVPGLEELARKSGTAAKAASPRLESSAEGAATGPESTAASSVPKCEAQEKPQGPHELEDLRHGLMATSVDVARLARDLANVREEHDTAIASIGGLMESLAKAATSSIQRIEARFATEAKPGVSAFERQKSDESSNLGSDCPKVTGIPSFDPRIEVEESGEENVKSETEATAVHDETSFAARRDAIAAEAFSTRRDAIVVEVMNLSKMGDNVASESTGKDGELHDIQLRIASRMASTEARIAAAETVMQADLRSLSSLLSTSIDRIEADLRPRISALEAVVAGMPRSLSPRRVGSTGTESVGFPRPHSPHKFGPLLSGFGGDGAELSAGHSIRAPPGYSSGSFVQGPVSELGTGTSQNLTRGMPRSHEQAFLREKLKGIVFSVNQVLGTLNLQHSSRSDISAESVDAALQSIDLLAGNLPSVSCQAEQQQQLQQQQQTQQLPQPQQPQQPQQQLGQPGQLGQLGRRSFGVPASARGPRQMRDLSPVKRLQFQSVSSTRFQQAQTPPVPPPMEPQSQQMARSPTRWGSRTAASLWDIPLCGSACAGRISALQQQQQPTQLCNELTGSPLGSPAVPPPGSYAAVTPRGGAVPGFLSPRNESGSVVAPPHPSHGVVAAPPHGSVVAPPQYRV